MANESATDGTGLQQLSAVDGLAQLSFVVQGSLQRLAGEHGVSIIQTRLLGVLRDRQPTMTDLARLLGLDKSSTTGLVDRAERRGLVMRTLAKEDRRSSRVKLTRAGRSLVSAVADRFAAEISEILETLAVEDRDALAKLVSELVVAHASQRGIDLFDHLGER